MVVIVVLGGRGRGGGGAQGGGSAGAGGSASTLAVPLTEGQLQIIRNSSEGEICMVRVRLAVERLCWRGRESSARGLSHGEGGEAEDGENLGGLHFDGVVVTNFAIEVS